MQRVYVCVFVLVSCFAVFSQDNSALSVTGGGTTNFIAKWTSSTNLSSSALCQSATGGLIGIGTCSPTQRLQVNSGNALVKGASNFTTNGQSATYYVGDTNHGVVAVRGKGLYFSTYKAPKPMFISDRITIDPNGSTLVNVGIGTTSPSALVDIEPGNAVCQSDGCVHGVQLFQVGQSMRVDLLGNTFLGATNSDGIFLSTGLFFPDGTFQKTAYTGAAAAGTEAATIQQLQRDRDALIRMVQQLQSRVTRLESRGRNSR